MALPSPRNLEQIFTLLRNTDESAIMGVETWLMRKALSNKLEVFLHRSIQQFLQVSVTKMKEEQIRNEHVRRMFYDIP
jgi:hypothetical protein